MSKELFKDFARKHKELAVNVMQGNTTWQKLYELYDIYGEDSSIWSDYFTSNVTSEEKTPTTFKEFFNTFKNMDMDSVQKGVTNLQKTIGLLQDLGLASLGGNKNLYTINYIKSNPPIYNFLRENSSWYKVLNRDSKALKRIEELAKEKYKLRLSDRLEKLSNNMNLISSFMDVLKE